MSPFRARTRRLVALVVGLLLAPLGGCSPDLTGIQEMIGGGLASITIYPDSAVVAVGDTVSMSATGMVSGLMGMFVYDPLPDAAWQVSDPNVARLETVPPEPTDSFPSAGVRVLGLRAGVAAVTVTARGVSAAARVRVVAADAPLAALKPDP